MGELPSDGLPGQEWGTATPWATVLSRMLGGGENETNDGYEGEC